MKGRLIGRRFPLLLMLVTALGSCAWWPGSHAGAGPTPEQALHAMLTAWGAVDDTVTVLGFYDRYGKSPASAPALDGVLLSALARRGVIVHPQAGIVADEPPKRLRFRDGSVLPDSWRELSGATTGLVLGAQIRQEAPWVYLRLALAEAGSGNLRAVSTARISQGALARTVAAADDENGVDTAPVLAPIDMKLHVVVRRDDAGFTSVVDVGEQVTLVEGDRLQVRLRTQQDCEAFIFLYASSDGQRQELLARQRIFRDRWNYAPGESQWITLGRGDEVYTLYVLVAPGIDEDRETLWERLDQWQTEGQIDHMAGIDLIDGAVADFLSDSNAGIDSLEILRGNDNIVAADEDETFAYSDGAVLTSTAEVHRVPVLLRAFSFYVRWK